MEIGLSAAFKMKIRFSDLSVYKLELLLEYLEEEWSVQVRQNFLEELKKQLEIIQANPYAYQASSIDPELRRCVISKQTSLLYEIGKDGIFVLNLIDSRQNPQSIRAEIRKHFGK
jgi:plasmid stabilization system protein ParE